MNVRRGLAIAFTLVFGACGTKPISIEFCELRASSADFAHNVYQMEIVAIPNYHGLLAGDFSCPGQVVEVSEAGFDATPELRDLRKSIDAAYQMHNPFTESHQPKGVAVQITGRIEKSTSQPTRLILSILSAGHSRIVDVPKNFFDLPKGVEPPSSDTLH